MKSRSKSFEISVLLNTPALETFVPNEIHGIRCDFSKVEKKNTLVPEMWVTRKIFTRAAANLFFLINLIGFF